ncbi:MAG: hypothetical protein U9N60_06000 [Thermodesulfobacteriota bacterium]|nr:hypothetical protein [Thermodesulfobacteriota bacterium]
MIANQGSPVSLPDPSGNQREFFALGNQRFKEKIAAMLDRRVTPGKAGRPRKKQREGG